MKPLMTTLIDVPGAAAGSETVAVVMNGFHCGYEGKSRMIPRTVEGGAAMMMSVRMVGMFRVPSKLAETKFCNQPWEK